MERITQTDKFVLIETEDIDFSVLRQAVVQYKINEEAKISFNEQLEQQDIALIT